MLSVFLSQLLDMALKKESMLDVLSMFALCKIVQEPIEFYLVYAFHFVLLFCVFCLFLEMYQPIGCCMSIKIKSLCEYMVF